VALTEAMLSRAEALAAAAPPLTTPQRDTIRAIVSSARLMAPGARASTAAVTRDVCAAGVPDVAA
jgi:hypothetical protein